MMESGSFGHGINSHGIPPGHGTLVVNSLGRTRIFFGHVCGRNAGTEQFAITRKFQTLSEFYESSKGSIPLSANGTLTSRPPP